MYLGIFVLRSSSWVDFSNHEGKRWPGVRIKPVKTEETANQGDPVSGFPPCLVSSRTELPTGSY